MTGVVTQNDLSAIINSAVAIMDSSVELVNNLSKSITKIKIADIGAIKKTKPTIIASISYLSDVVYSIMDSKLFNDTDMVNKLAQNGGNHISIVLKNIGEILSYIPKSIESISKMDLGFVAALKLKRKIKRIPSLFTTLISDMQKSLLSIIKSNEFQEFYEYVSESEQVIEESTKGDNSNKKTVKKLKQKGVINVLVDYIKLFTDMGGLGDAKFQASSMMKVKINMTFLSHLLSTSLNHIITSLKNVDTSNMSDKMDVLEGSIKSYNDMIESMGDMSKNVIKLLTLSKMLPLINPSNIISYVVSISEIKLAKIKKSKEVVSEIIPLLNDFNSIIQVISKLGIKLIGVKMLNFMYKAISLVGNIIEKILVVVDDISTKRLRNADKSLTQIKGIIWSVATIISALILMTPILIGFALISPVLLVALWAFKLVTEIIVRTIMSIASVKVSLAIIGLIGLIGLMLTAGAFIYLLITLSIEIVKGIVPLIAFFGIVALVTLSIIGIGWLLVVAAPVLAPTALGIVALTIVIGAMFLMGVMLKTLEVLNLDRSAILYNVNTILDTAHEIIRSIFENTIEMGGGKKTEPWYKQVLSFMGGAAASLASAILAIPTIALSVISVGLMLFMAAELRLLQTLKLDSGKILTNVGNVLDIAKSISGLIFGPDTTEKAKADTPWYKKVFDWAGGTVKTLIDGILSAQFLATSLISTIFIKMIAKRLVKISKLNLNRDEIRSKVTDIIDCSKMLISTIWSKDTTEKSDESSNSNLRKLFEWAFPNLTYMVDAIMSVGFLAVSIVSVGMIKKLAENLTEINNVPDLTGISTKVKTIIDSSREVIKSVFDGRGLKGFIKDAVSFVKVIPTLDNMNRAVGGVAQLSNSLYSIIKDCGVDPIVTQNQTRILDKHIEFINKISSVDVEKLKTSANMFEKMAEFSESINGNFEGLAQTLNEKIAPLMEELKELLTGVQDKVEETGANMSKAAFNSGKTLSEPEMTAQVASENPRARDDEKARMVQQRMEEQARNQTNAITSKLDELIELFKNGMAQVRTA